MGKRDIIRTVGSSWFALGINVLVGIFFSPYILHRLGDEALGLWISIFSLSPGITDFSTSASDLPSFATSLNTPPRGLYRLLITAMFGYTDIGIVTMTATLIMTYYMHSTFPKIAAGFVPTAPWLLLMVGTSASLGFPMGVFSGILEGLQRFYLLNLTNTCSTLLRALLIVVAYVALDEGTANLILSIILLRPYGIVGDTIGTAIPLTCSMIFFLPRHLCRLLGIKIRTYLYRAFSLPLMLCAPVVAVLFAHAALVHSSSLARASDTSRDSQPGVRAGLLWAFWAGRAWDCRTLGCE
jgi:hypothetical protein